MTPIHRVTISNPRSARDAAASGLCCWVAFARFAILHGGDAAVQEGEDGLADTPAFADDMISSSFNASTGCRLGPSKSRSATGPLPLPCTDPAPSGLQLEESTILHCAKKCTSKVSPARLALSRAFAVGGSRCVTNILSLVDGVARVLRQADEKTSVPCSWLPGYETATVPLSRSCYALIDLTAPPAPWQLGPEALAHPSARFSTSMVQTSTRCAFSLDTATMQVWKPSSSNSPKRSAAPIPSKG